MRNLLPTGEYHATITQSYKAQRHGHDRIFLCFTIDSGKYSYRNLLKSYPLTKDGVDTLNGDFSNINFVLYKNVEEQLFYDQFLNPDLRVKLIVDRSIPLREGTLINIIREIQLPTEEQEYNVKKEKSEQHYHKGNKGRSLPIKEREYSETKRFSKGKSQSDTRSKEERNSTVTMRISNRIRKNYFSNRVPQRSKSE